MNRTARAQAWATGGAARMRFGNAQIRAADCPASQSTKGNQMTSLGFIESTTKLALTAEAATFEGDGTAGARRQYHLIGNVAFHVARNAVATPDGAMFVPANTGVTVSMFATDSLSLIKASGVEDGDAWLTLIDR